MMKRLLLVHPRQFGYAAGYFHYCKYLREVFDVHFLCFDHGLKRVELEGVAVTYLPRSPRRLAGELRLALAMARQLQAEPDRICLFSYSRFCALPRLLVPDPRRLILDIRSGSLAPAAAKRRVDNLLIRTNARFFHHVMTLSVSLRRKLRLPPKRTRVVSLGAERLDVPPKKYDTLKLLYVGTLGRRRIADTVHGFAEFAKTVPAEAAPSYDILGFGPDNEIEAVRQAAAAAGVADRVTYHGHKQYAEAEAFFRKCNVGVSYVPRTDYYDCQPPTKTFEYVLAGMPCIATDTLENRALINETNGVLCADNAGSFADALARVYAKRAAYEFAAIRQSLHEFEWGNVVRERLMPFLEDVIRGVSAPR